MNGRVDRFGQPRPKVPVLTYYGIDNRIDGIALDVLIRKHKTIRSSLGLSVPVPIERDAVVGAVFEGLLLRETADTGQDFLPGLEAYVKPKRDDLYAKWDAAAEREKRSRTMFAQESIKVDEVAREIAEARASVGSAEDVARFTIEAAPAGNISPEQAEGFVRKVIEAFDHLRPEIEAEAGRRAEALLEAHRRVRQAARARGTTHEVEAKLPPDLIGVYVYLPAA